MIQVRNQLTVLPPALNELVLVIEFSTCVWTHTLLESDRAFGLSRLPVRLKSQAYLLWKY